MTRSKRPGNRPTIRRMLETTPARVSAPGPAAAVDEPIPDEDLGWEPLGLPRAVRSRRTYRIPVILISLAAATGLYFAAQLALRLPLAHAHQQRDQYTAALQVALDAMPGLQDAAAAITGQFPSSDLGIHLSTVVRVGGVASELQAAAAQPAPLMVPGFPTEDLDLLEPIRGRMETIADRITSVGGVLGDVAAYRRVLDGMFLLPELPGPSEGPSVEILSDRLAQMAAATVGSAALLPDDERFAGHRSQVEALIEWLPDWQAAYLEALRDGDLGRADSLRAGAVGRIDRLRADLSGPLGEASAWAWDAVARLTLDIQAALILSG